MESGNNLDTFLRIKKEIFTFVVNLLIVWLKK